MERSLKLLLGVATAVPLVLGGYLLVRFVSSFFDVIGNDGMVSASQMQDTFSEFAAMQLGVLAVTIVLLGVYLWHLLVRHARQQIDVHVPIWVLALVLVPVIAMPVYWFTVIWPEPEGRPEQPHRV